MRFSDIVRLSYKKKKKKKSWKCKEFISGVYITQKTKCNTEKEHWEQSRVNEPDMRLKWSTGTQEGNRTLGAQVIRTKGGKTNKERKWKVNMTQKVRTYQIKTKGKTKTMTMCLIIDNNIVCDTSWSSPLTSKTFLTLLKHFSEEKKNELIYNCLINFIG